tara:strand:+ start:75 stop:1103 length:1029 start_codon:yes stop_codon:yes gene_type:complete
MAYSKARRLANVVDSSGVVSYESLSDGTITVTAFADEDNMSSDSATLLSTQQSIKAYVDSVKGDMQFILEDGDGTEVQLTKDKEVKFVEGGGIDINWTDTDNGTDGDPFDLTFTVNPAQTTITSLLATDIKIGEDNETKIDFEDANEINFYADNEKKAELTSTGLKLIGTTPTLTIGDAGAEDTKIVFDGNAQDFYVGLDDTADDLVIGLGSAVGTTPAIHIDENQVVTFDAGVSEEYTAVSSSSNATTINCRVGNTFAHTLTENTTFTFSNPAASGKTTIFLLKLIQDSTARTVTWPNSVDWAAATAPTITTTNAGVDIFVFMTHDAGTTWYGFTAGQALG